MHFTKVRCLFNFTTSTAEEDNLQSTWHLQHINHEIIITANPKKPFHQEIIQTRKNFSFFLATG